MNGRDRLAAEQRWQAFHDGLPLDDVRPDVLGSWRRSATQVPASIDHAPLADEAPRRWRETREARAFETIAPELAGVAIDGDFVAAVTDPGGTIVWTTGGRTMARRAERVAFEPGGRWSEDAVGTNALALALTDGRPATVWSAEHYAPIVHDWVCYAAPVTDPATGGVCGVVDLSTSWRRATPLALTTVTALARLMGHSLSTIPVVDAAPTLRLRTLGHPRVLLGDHQLVLPPRHVELLTVLSLAPDGLTLEQLHDRLYGDRPVSPNTTKAELSHLRRVLRDHLANRPYRILAPFEADHDELRDALDRRQLDRVLDLYAGPLVPASDAPAIVEERHIIDVAVRAAVIHDGDADRLARFAAMMPHDAHVQELAVNALAAGDPRGAMATARLDLLVD